MQKSKEAQNQLIEMYHYLCKNQDKKSGGVQHGLLLRDSICFQLTHLALPAPF
ncbi:MAG TPA: hypothetical protein VK106_06440 [Balneolaceae bacterium]|nr:hypothetical protein [Balneolaceae bacterium]